MKLAFLLFLLLLSQIYLTPLTANSASPVFYEDMSISIGEDQLGLVVLVSSTLASPLNFPASDQITPYLGKDIDKAVLSITAQNTELQIFLLQLSNGSIQIGDQVAKTVAQTLNIDQPSLQTKTTAPNKWELYAAFNISLPTAWPKLKPLSMPISEGYGNLIDTLAMQPNQNSALQMELELDENNSPLATIIFSTKIPAEIRPGETVDILKQLGVSALEASPSSNDTTFTITIPRQGVATVEYGGATMQLDESNPNTYRLRGTLPTGTHIESLWIRTIPLTTTTTTTTTTATTTTTTTTTNTQTTPTLPPTTVETILPLSIGAAIVVLVAILYAVRRRASLGTPTSTAK